MDIGQSRVKSDLALFFAIFVIGHIATDQVLFQEFNSKKSASLSAAAVSANTFTQAGAVSADIAGVSWLVDLCGCCKSVTLKSGSANNGKCNNE